MRGRQVAGVVVASCLAALAGAGPTQGAFSGLPMLVTTGLNVPSSLAQFPVYDGAGTLLRSETYRLTNAGGNCCEKYVAATRDGRLLEIGGSYPYFSDDAGVTWNVARPPVPLVNGEGAIVAAPNGDIVGTSWDAFSGDRLVAFKYTAADGTWSYHENPQHGPFFDRPWVSVVEGPFTFGTTTVPYISIVRGGSGLGRDVELVSYDGLVYTEYVVTGPAGGLLPERPGPLTLAADPDTDLLQPHPQSRTSPLPGTGAIRIQQTGLLCSSRTQVLGPDRQWYCLDLGTQQLAGDIRADSRGWLHEVRYGTSSVTYRVSTNGGASWQSTTHTLPGAITGTKPDVKVDSTRSLLYVALRVTGTSGQQDTVLRFDNAGGTPSLRDVYHVGLGDRTAGWALGSSPRMDFASIALLPDGRFAVAYEDSTTVSGIETRPFLAIIQ